MPIQTDQKIVGHPALQVRQLIQETVGRPITLRYVQEILKCSDSSAKRVMRKLEAEGFAHVVHGHLEPSTKGSALATAKAAPPLRREKAERLISDVIDRTRAVNRDGKWAYRIGKLVIFGSCVRGAERPNDVDIACELVPQGTSSILDVPIHRIPRSKLMYLFWKDLNPKLRTVRVISKPDLKFFPKRWEERESAGSCRIGGATGTPSRID